MIKNIPNRCLQAAHRVRLYCRSLYHHLSSWYQHQDLNRVIRSKTSRTLVALTLLIVFIAQLLLPNQQNALGATLLFTQSNWSDGASSTAIAVDPTNRTNWAYFNTSTNMDFTSSTAPRLTSSSYSATDDDTLTGTGGATGGGFGNGINSQTASANGNITLDTSVLQNVNAWDSVWPATPDIITNYRGRVFVTNSFMYVLATSTASNKGVVHYLDISAKTWATFPDLPTTTAEGSDMVVNSTHVYVLTGGGTTTTYRHSLVNTTSAWESFPAFPGSATAKNGGNIAIDDNFVYILPGANANTSFYRHTLLNTTDPWETFTPLPSAVNVYGRMIIASNTAFVLLGGNVVKSHSLANTSSPWESYAALPNSIDSGSGIAFKNNYIYILQGGSSGLGFWRHTISDTSTTWESFANLSNAPSHVGNLFIDDTYAYVLSSDRMMRHTLSDTSTPWESSILQSNLFSSYYYHKSPSYFDGTNIYVLRNYDSNQYYILPTSTFNTWSGTSRSNWTDLPLSGQSYSSVAIDDDYLYVLRGGNAVYRHGLTDPAASWEPFSATPVSLASSAFLHIDDNYVYVGKGSWDNSSFARHTKVNTSSDWESFDGVLCGSGNFYGGRATGDNSFVYILCAGDRKKVYRHTTATISGAWDTYADLPTGASGGSGFTVDNNFLYVVPANNTAKVYRHTLSDTSSPWDTFTDLPGNVAGGSYDNSPTMLNDGTYIYVSRVSGGGGV